MYVIMCDEKASNDEEMMIEIEKNQNNRNGRADN